MVGRPIVARDLPEKWDRWIALVTEMHAEFRIDHNRPIHFSRLKRPLEGARVALLSTAGVHLREDPPFDLAAPGGDPTIRLIPGGVDAGDLTVSHMHYDTAMALQDIDCIFPITAARMLQQAGVIGELASVHYGLMGFVPNAERLIDETGPELARRLVDDGVDALVMVPG